MSNLVSQLEAAGLIEKLPAVLEECGRIRAETGWPIMVTPFSQFVGVQATLNVLTGSRYTQVPDEMKKYALGYYGDLLSPVEPDVLDRIVENGSKAIALTPPTPEPALPALRERYPEASDEELLLWHSFPEELVTNMFAATPDETDYGENTFLHLVEEIAKRPDLSRVFVSKGDTSVDIRGR